MKFDKNTLTRFQQQELEDYQTTEKILFSLYGNKITDIINRNDLGFGESDVLYTAISSTHKDEISLEIKTVNPDERTFRNGMMLKLAKLIKLKKDRDSRNPNERLLIIYLCTRTRNYYIYDLDGIDLNNIKMDVMKIKMVQYKDDSPYEQTPILYLPFEKTIMKGQY